MPQSEDARDARHLELLAIFHFIVAGLRILMSGFIVLHYLIMRPLFMNPEFWKGQPLAMRPPAEFLHVFIWFYVIFFGYAWLSAAATIAAGVMLKRRKARLFILAVAGVNCLAIPVGATLAVFTIITLTRESVRRKFGN